MAVDRLEIFVDRENAFMKVYDSEVQKAPMKTILGRDCSSPRNVRKRIEGIFKTDDYALVDRIGIGECYFCEEGFAERLMSELEGNLSGGYELYYAGGGRNGNK